MVLPFTPRLKISRLDFTRKERGKVLTTIHELWIDPLVPEQAPKKGVYLEVKDEEVFTLQRVHLSEKGLTSELTAMTDTLWVGKEKPFPNKVPSLLVYLVEHKVFKTVCHPLGLC
jgi:hypothetical protein